MGRVGGIGFRKVFGWLPESFRVADAVDRSERAGSNRNNCGKLTQTRRFLCEIRSKSVPWGPRGALLRTRGRLLDPKAFRSGPGGVRGGSVLKSGLTAGPQRAPRGLHLGPFWELFFGRFSDTFSVELREPFRERFGAVLDAFWGRFRSFFRRRRRSFGGGTVRFQFLL